MLAESIRLQLLRIVRNLSLGNPEHLVIPLVALQGLKLCEELSSQNNPWPHVACHDNALCAQRRWRISLQQVLAKTPPSKPLLATGYLNQPPPDVLLRGRVMVQDCESLLHISQSQFACCLRLPQRPVTPARKPLPVSDE